MFHSAVEDAIRMTEQAIRVAVRAATSIRGVPTADERRA